MYIRILSLIVLFCGSALSLSAQQVSEGSAPNPEERRAIHQQAQLTPDSQQLELLFARIAEAVNLNDHASVQAMRPDVLQATEALLTANEDAALYPRLEFYQSTLQNVSFSSPDGAKVVLRTLKEMTELIAK